MNNEIADELHISVRTVESHISSLLAKLDSESRAGLVAAGISTRR
jgi:DNA-binding NarL/FixJ family response regulator